MSWRLDSIKIPFIDRSFAEAHLPKISDANQAEACLLAFLLGAARAGHLYIEIKNKMINPAPNLIWEMAQSINELLSRAADTISHECIVREHNRFYLKRLFNAKDTCLNEWSRLGKASYIQNEPVKLSSELTSEQAQAVHMAGKSAAFILTGGPGTGKTFTAAAIIKAHWENLSEGARKEHSIALTAPTGKAALTLHHSIARCLPNHEILTRLKAKTLHALVGHQTDKLLKERSILPEDLIVIDEASMIDVELMAHVLSSIKTGAKVLLIGDPYQLPPVEGPAIFSELIANEPNQVELTRCLRIESDSLAVAAQAVRLGKTLQQSACVKQLDLPTDALQLVEQYADRFLSGETSFRILTPLRKGPFGSEQINQAFQQTFQNKGINRFPILVTANNQKLNLFNGETGLLVKNSPSDTLTDMDVVLFPNGRKLPAILLTKFEWAYAMTVHKSQGSEFDEVALLLPSCALSYSPALIYTAVTRARKKLMIYS